jgi:tetratricopeptide (TPR) repeat protein
MLGKVKGWEGDAAGAEASLSTAIAAGYDDVSALRLRGSARSDHDAGANDAEIFLKRGMSRLHQNNAEGAESDFTSAIDRGGQPALGYYGRAMARALRSDLAGTFDDCSEAIAHGVSDAAVCAMRARAGARLGRLEVTEADCARLETIAPEAPQTRASRADLYLAQGDYDSAVRSYRSSIETSGGANDLQVYVSLILALRLAGRVDESDKAYVDAFEQADASVRAAASSEVDQWARDRPALAAATASLRTRLDSKRSASV